jgi:hypothetical protein
VSPLINSPAIMWRLSFNSNLWSATPHLPLHGCKSLNLKPYLLKGSQPQTPPHSAARAEYHSSFVLFILPSKEFSYFCQCSYLYLEAYFKYLIQDF